MKYFTRDQFVSFCRTKGDEQYNPIEIYNCAFTQFFKSELSTVRSSTVDFETGEILAVENSFDRIGKLNLEMSDVLIVMNMDQTFADIVTQFEGGSL